MGVRRAHLRRRSERGVALVETAMVALLLVGLVTATFELGMAWRSSITNAQAARAGARVASSQGVARLADHAAILAVSSGLRSADSATINKIVIFRSTTSDGTVPAACLTETALTSGGNSTARCNVYSTARISQIVSNPAAREANFAGTCSGSSQWDRFWCPSTRNNVQLSTGGLDYVGVYVEIAHPTFSKVFGDTITITDTSVMRIEPSAGDV